MVDNFCNGNLVERSLRNQFIRAFLQLRVNDISLCGLRAIRPAFLGLLHTISDLSMRYYVFRNEQQFLQPLGSGSWNEVKGLLDLGAESCHLWTVISKVVMQTSCCQHPTSKTKLGWLWNMKSFRDRNLIFPSQEKPYCFTHLPFVYARRCSKSISAQIKCKTFVHKHRILNNDQ
jgi:hypothetical protein